SQAHQCFYVKDPYEANKHYAMVAPPRDLFLTSEGGETESRQPFSGELDDNLTSPAIPSYDGELALERTELGPTVIEVAPHTKSAEDLEADSTDKSDSNYSS
ncbi:hypothetical protein PIB30_108371, partial [Stylosanthes scabra]|nr:hypothetical protein [Stylosanthes scabra]